jgi:hypothetical protein
MNDPMGRTHLILSSIALSLCACSGELELHQADEGIRLQFAPELAPAADAAAARLLAATGLDVLAGSLVVPVLLAESHEAMPNEKHCAATTTTYTPDGVVSIQTLVSPLVFDPESLCGDAELNVLHELGHVLRSWLSGPEQKKHAESGVFMARASGGDGRLNDASLAYLCSDVSCLWFRPETTQ